MHALNRWVDIGAISELPIFVLNKYLIMKHVYKLVFLISFLLNFGLVSNAQTKEQDSIETKLKGMTDAQKVDYLSSTINSIIFQYPERVFNYLSYYEKIPMVYTDSTRKCYVYNTKGLCYEMLGEYSTALDYNFRALKLAESINDSLRMAYCMADIGFIYESHSKQYDISLSYQKKALKIYKEMHNYKEEAGSYINIGNIYRNLKQIDSAIYYHKKSISTCLIYSDSIDSNPKNERNLALNYSCLADDYQLTEYNDSVLYYKDKARHLLEKNGFEFELSTLYHGYAYYYYVKQDYEMSLKYIKKALDIALALNLKKNQLDCYEGMSELYKELGDYKNAYHSMVKRFNLIDSLNLSETREKLAELQAKYDYELNKQKIEKLELDSKVKDLNFKMLVYGVFVVIFIVIIILTSLFLKRKKDKQLAIEKDKQHESERLLTKLEQEKAELLNQELKLEIEFKNKELTSHALSMMQKNKLMQELIQRIDAFRKTATDEQKDELKKVRREIQRYLRTDKDWDLFKLYFEKVNNDFFENLKSINSDLSVNDLRLAALVRLNMNIKESATVLNIAPNSIKSARYRLRKKLNLDPDDSLYNFIQSV